MPSPDERIEKLLEESADIAALNTGSEVDHRNPALIEWYSRAKSAVADKVGEDTHVFQEIKNLDFWGFTSVYDETTPADLKGFFADDLHRVVAALKAALEASERRAKDPQPLVQVRQEQSGASATAAASSVARVDVQVSVSELRYAIINAEELSPEEQGEAISALPASDDEVPTLDKVEKLLKIATRAKGLLKPVLGWVLMQADRIQFP